MLFSCSCPLPNRVCGGANTIRSYFQVSKSVNFAQIFNSFPLNTNNKLLSTRIRDV